MKRGEELKVSDVMSTGAGVTVLSQRQLNRALLARQLLLERTNVSIPAALEQLAGIQNQYAPNAYIRLWSCLEGFARQSLTRAYEEGSVVQGTLMRGTIHTVSAADYRLFAAGIRPALRKWAERVYPTPDDGRQTLDGRKTLDDPEALVARVRTALAGRSLPRAELQALRAEASAATWATVDIDAELLRVPPSGTWERRRANTYGLAADWLHPESLRGREPDAESGLAHLIGRYLGGFGPASAADIATFTGVPLAALKLALARVTVRRFRDEKGVELLDLPDAFIPDGDTPAPVRFLPTWDATLLVHARRTQILPEEYRPRVFNTKTPQSVPTFLVDGQVAGTWRYEEGRIVLAPFDELSTKARRAAEEEAERLAAFHMDGPA